ncbi:CHAT domain-containing protein [Acrocarpospora catenulata]|uniref:CHAT domain-containing protein n=1 Tax=Acrocarpospora catenulata TaxID=2836182 RepID=UPI001BD9220E|nr:CHAT domain-containing protein [Acrocarpospora catenulata]
MDEGIGIEARVAAGRARLPQVIGTEWEAGHRRDLAFLLAEQVDRRGKSGLPADAITDVINEGIDHTEFLLQRNRTPEYSYLSATFHRARFEATGRLADLDAAIGAYERAEADGLAGRRLWALGELLFIRFENTETPADLERSIRYLRTALAGGEPRADCHLRFADALLNLSLPVVFRAADPMAYGLVERMTPLVDAYVGEAIEHLTEAVLLDPRRADAVTLLNLAMLAGGAQSAPATESYRRLDAAVAALSPDDAKRAALVAVRHALGRIGWPVIEPTDDAEDQIARLERAVSELPEGHRLRPAVAAVLVGSRAAGQRRLRLEREAIGSVERGLRAESLTDLDHGLDLLRVALRTPSLSGFSPAELILGLGLARRAGISGRRRDLDEAIGHLESVADELSGQPAHPFAGAALGWLALAHRQRGHAAKAVRTGLAALRERAGQVLLLSGTGRSRVVARLLAAEALEIAGWALDDGLPERAVEALELGRGLLLHQATSTLDVLDVLTAAGEDNLATEWATVRDHAPAPDREHDLTALVTYRSFSPALPHRLLRHLGAPSVPLLSPPTTHEIATALRTAGADAFVYLTPTGQTVVVRPNGGVSLPTLPAPDVRLAAYLAASGGEWRKAFGELCGWAGSVVAPLLAAITPQRKADQEISLVVVPWGSLGRVPWHAARIGGRYACELARFSYAASASEFIAAVGRAGDPVVVTDPEARATWPPGALAVLATCDPGPAGYDEAGTYASALMARGAAAVVAPRWAIADQPGAAAMLAAFHTFLDESGRAGEALHRAQLWMLDPHRRPLPEMPDTDLTDPVLWGAFGHQGW